VDDKLNVTELFELRELRRESIRAGLARLVKEAHQTSKDKGWHPDVPYDNFKNAMMRGDSEDKRRVADRVAAMLFLIADEAHEAGKVLRAPGDTTSEAAFKAWVGEITKELADVVIRVADLAGWLNGDLPKEITDKLEINLSRDYRHGNKLI